MTERVNTVIVGGGQAGLAMSAHLRTQGIDHLVLERDRIAERWRSARWDSLVANGPAWHDRFPAQEFAGIGGDDFATRDDVVAYFRKLCTTPSIRPSAAGARSHQSPAGTEPRTF